MKYDDLLEITSCFNSTTGEVDRKYIGEIVDRIIASCAAGPWQDGPPPKDGKYWLVKVKKRPTVIWWYADTQVWLVAGSTWTVEEKEIKFHAPINLPEE
jgi:hypothetical protein